MPGPGLQAPNVMCVILSKRPAAPAVAQPPTSASRGGLDHGSVGTASLIR